MESQFYGKIQVIREKRCLYARTRPTLFGKDAAQLSKIEKGARQLILGKLALAANTLMADTDELRTLWVSDQIRSRIKAEKLANEAILVPAKNFNTEMNRQK